MQVAREELDSDLRVKESASDVVQKSFLEASVAFDKFVGDSLDDLKAWLRQMSVGSWPWQLMWPLKMRTGSGPGPVKKS